MSNYHVLILIDKYNFFRQNEESDSSEILWDFEKVQNHICEIKGVSYINAKENEIEIILDGDYDAVDFVEVVKEENIPFTDCWIADDDGEIRDPFAYACDDIDLCDSWYS